MTATLTASLRCCACNCTWSVCDEVLPHTTRQVAALLLAEACPDCREINPVVVAMRFVQVADPPSANGNPLTTRETVVSRKCPPAAVGEARVIPSPDEVLAAQTAAGGWTAKSLAAWGVSWPPLRGWRRQLEIEWQQREEEKRYSQ